MNPNSLPEFVSTSKFPSSMRFVSSRDKLHWERTVTGPTGNLIQIIIEDCDITLYSGYSPDRLCNSFEDAIDVANKLAEIHLSMVFYLEEDKWNNSTL